MKHERVQRDRWLTGHGFPAVSGSSGEQVDGITLAFAFEKLPHDPHFHQRRHLVLDAFHSVMEFEGFRVAVGQRALEVSAKTQVPNIKHLGIDIIPELGELGHITNLAVRVGRCAGRHREINRRAALGRCGRNGACGGGFRA